MTEFNAYNVAQAASTAQPRNRSRACLHCRRRKMRCDGVKPACFQCVRADRGNECEYDDGTTKTATQLLYEKLHRLEKRYRELQAQNPSHPRLGAHAKSAAKRGSTAASSSSSRGARAEPSIRNSQFQHNIGSYNATTSASSGSSVASTPTPPLPPQLHLEPMHPPFDPSPQFYDKGLPSLSYSGPEIAENTSTSLHFGGSSSALMGAESYPLTHQNNLQSSMNVQFPGPLDIPEPIHPEEVTDEPTPALAQYLIESFLPHSQQCGLSIRSEFLLLHGSRTPSPVSNNHSHGTWPGASAPPSPPLSQVAYQLHPALINAVFMWGAHFATDKTVLPLANIFAKRATDALPALVQLASGSSTDRTAAASGSRSNVAPHVLIQAIQAATLLTTYYYSQDRKIEGSYHANTANVLAMSAGLHRMADASINHADSGDFGSDSAGRIALPPPRDALEWAERLLTFWNAFIIDCTWGSIEGYPNQRWGECMAGRSSKITAPWPKDLETYGAYSPVQDQYAHVRQQRPGSTGCTLLEFLLGRDINNNASRLEIRAKSAALYAVATRFEKRNDKSIDFRAHFSTAQATVEQFLRTLQVSPPQRYHSSSFADTTLVTSRAIALATDIRLHFQLSSSSPSALERSLGAAREILQGVLTLVPEDYLYLEPIIASCWSLAAMVFVRILSRMPPSTSGMSERVRIHNDIEKLINALKMLGSVFPAATSQAQKVEVALRGGKSTRD